MTPRTPTAFEDDLRRLESVTRPMAINFPDPPPRPVDPFPGYTNVREITRNTYSASPRGTDEIVVLRVIPTRHFNDPRNQMRIESNLERAIYLREMGIAAIHSRGTSSDGRPFLARQHISGVPIDVFNLGHAFAMGAPPSINDVIKVFAEVCRGVHRAHQKGVLHGGLKPTNILVNEQGQPHVADFGLNLSPANAVADDVISLGRMLFELLRDRPLPPDAALTAIAAQATSSDPRHAYASAGALADDLERFLTNRPLSIEVPSLASVVAPWLDRHVGDAGRVIVVGVFTGLITGLFTTALCSTSGVAGLVANRTVSSLVSGPVMKIWFAGIALLLLTFGLLAERLGRARTDVGTLWCGGIAGVIAAFFAWAAGAGGAIASIINRAALAEAGRLSSITNSDEHLVQLLAAPATTAAFAAGWLSPLIPFVICVGFGFVGAWASRFIRRGLAPLPEMVLTYVELTLPAQCGILLVALLAIGDAAGMIPATRVWVGPLTTFAVAALCWMAIRNGVPALTRAACYMGLFALIVRLTGRAMPLWVEIPIYLVTFLMIVVYIQSPKRGPRNVFE